MKHIKIEKVHLFLCLIVIVMTLSSVVFAQSLTYDFDEVNVLYAAEFTAKPVDDPKNTAYQDTWVADITGDDLKITVTYGIVELKKDDKVMVVEEFLKVGGNEGSKRFLRNSFNLGGDGTRRSFFWSAKKLEGTSVIKDFTLPIYSATFSRTSDQDGNKP